MLPASRSSSVPPRRSPRARRTVTLLGAGTVALALAAALAAPSGAVESRAGGGGQPTGPRTTGGLPGDLSARLSADEPIPQTSDGKPGLVAAPISSRKVAKARTITNTITTQYAVAPGITFARFDRLDSVRGNSRGQLLVLDQGTPGLSIDYAAPRKVAKTVTVDKLTAHAGAIAGVNGDFFDIGDTGASLGIGSGRADGLVKGPLSGWNSAFWVDTTGVPHIGSLEVKTTIKKHRNMRVDALNPPSVPQGGIAAYDEDWGALRGYQVTDLQKKRIRIVTVRGGRVVSNRTSIPRYLKVKGKVLIGRGKGAQKLAKLRVGNRTGIVSRIPGTPPVAITGNKALLIGGVRQVIDDTEMHPRTAIGIDHDTNRVLILVVDGRQSFSRGMTMVEMAQLMAQLGADDALNLDGGGSSTMMAPDVSGVMTVQNSPSDGFLRRVANGLVVTFDPAAGAQPTVPPVIFPPPVTPTPTASPTTPPSPPPSVPTTP